MRIDRDPALIAYQLADECRALVTATAKPAQLDTAEAVRDVAEGLHLAAGLLPQAVRQAAAALRALEEQQALGVAGGGDAGEAVSLVLRAFLNAEVGLTVARAALREACEPLSRLGGEVVAGGGGSSV
ncbi:hypothetical protein ACFW81_23815 [Streptomyces angustmyceticus]|uniref:hypothetical protein n=1 Tax=Streptomyces angustmyceticus TaxID=285578 RepID=UPI0036A08326